MRTKFQAFGGASSEEVADGLWYCKQRHLWWKDGVIYDELSASHNGLIGLGEQLRKTLKRI
jgi:hypothetical protein